MSYSLNGTDLSAFGFEPGRQPGSNIALSGFFDMPARIGKTYHSWGDSNGVQPYVSASEIRFGGRDLTLVGFIRGSDRGDVLNKCQSIRDFVNSFTDLVPLSCAWGTYSVRIGSIPINSLHATTAEITINMREPVVNLSGSLPTVDNGEYGIDDISFAALGISLVNFAGDRLGRPGTKPEQFTSWINEGYQITPTEQAKLDLNFLIQETDYSEVLGIIQGLYALFSKPGTRMLNTPNDTYREFFLTDGFVVDEIRSGANFTARLNIKPIQVSDNWYFLTDNSLDYITDNNYNKILIH